MCCLKPVLWGGVRAGRLGRRKARAHAETRSRRTLVRSRKGAAARTRASGRGRPPVRGRDLVRAPGVLRREDFALANQKRLRRPVREHLRGNQ